jgi:hypothetical protein
MSEEAKSAKSKVLYLIEQNIKTPNTARSSNSMISTERSQVKSEAESEMPHVIPSDFDTDSEPVLLNPEDDENKQKRFNDLFSNLDFEGDPDVKDLHDRDRTYELEAELTKIRLRERELVRELNMLKIQTGEVDPSSQRNKGPHAMASFQPLEGELNRKVDCLSEVKEEQDPMHSTNIKQKLKMSLTDLSPSMLAMIKRSESQKSGHFTPYMKGDEEEENIRPNKLFHAVRTPEKHNVPAMSVREQLLMKAARQRARQNGQMVDEAYNFLDDADVVSPSSIESKHNFGTYHGRNHLKMDVGALSPKGSNVRAINYKFGREDTNSPVNLEFRTESSDTYLAVEDIEEVEFINSKRRK